MKIIVYEEDSFVFNTSAKCSTIIDLIRIVIQLTDDLNENSKIQIALIDNKISIQILYLCDSSSSIFHVDSIEKFSIKFMWTRSHSNNFSLMIWNVNMINCLYWMDQRTLQREKKSCWRSLLRWILVSQPNVVLDSL